MSTMKTKVAVWSLGTAERRISKRRFTQTPTPACCRWESWRQYFCALALVRGYEIVRTESGAQASSRLNGRWY